MESSETDLVRNAVSAQLTGSCEQILGELSQTLEGLGFDAQIVLDRYLAGGSLWSGNGKVQLLITADANGKLWFQIMMWGDFSLTPSTPAAYIMKDVSGATALSQIGAQGTIQLTCPDDGSACTVTFADVVSYQSGSSAGICVNDLCGACSDFPAWFAAIASTCEAQGTASCLTDASNVCVTSWDAAATVCAAATGNAASECGGDGCCTNPPPPPEVCNDTADNDEDGKADCLDEDCASDPICTPPVVEICNNNEDDDGDMMWDCQDPDCANDPACWCQSTEEMQGTAVCSLDTGLARMGDIWPPDFLPDGMLCTDIGFGQFGEGINGCVDAGGHGCCAPFRCSGDLPGCLYMFELVKYFSGGEAPCDPAMEGCLDLTCGLPFGGDPAFSCDEVSNCCVYTPPPPEDICDDGIDNNNNGNTDCADWDCCVSGLCDWHAMCGGIETVCDDGIDNDGDWNTDCADWDCSAEPSCHETICDDGIDNDGDWQTDCMDSGDCCPDPACSGNPACSGPVCGNMICEPGEDAVSCPPDCGAPPPK
jgi:hypothetical protein